MSSATPLQTASASASESRPEEPRAPEGRPPEGRSQDPRSHEPSMEEILASIRRIIADDQSLPGRLAEASQAGVSAITAQGGHVSDPAVHVLRMPPQHDASAPPAPADDEPAEAGGFGDMMVRHGAIAAPQFASPTGPRTAEEPVAAAMAEPEGTGIETPVHGGSRNDVADAGYDGYDASGYDEGDGSGEGDDVAPPSHAEVDASHGFEPEAHQAFRGGASRTFGAESRAIGAGPGHVHQDAPREAEPASLFSEETDHTVASAFNMLAATRLADNSDELLTLARDMIRPLLRDWIDENLPGMVERMVRAEIERVARGGR